MTVSETHWLTRYDPDDGEPYGEVCRCSIGDDHDATRELNNLDPKPELVENKDEDDEVPLKTVVIQVCENCINRAPGTCHMPGCFYIWHSIEDVPTYLEMYVGDSGVT